MSIQEIYNLIIAAVPALTAIVTVLTLTIKMVSSLVSLKHSFKDNADAQKAIVDELKAANASLQTQVVETNKTVSALTEQVNKTLEHSQQTNEIMKSNEQEVRALKKQVDKVESKTATIDAEVDALCQK